MGREDYSSSTVDGAAGAERCRAASYGPWDDEAADLRSEFPRERVCRHPDPRDPDYDGPDEDEGPHRDEAKVKALTTDLERDSAEAESLLATAKNVCWDDWCKESELVECGKKPDDAADDFLEEALKKVEGVKKCSEAVWELLRSRATAWLEWWKEKADF